MVARFFAMQLGGYAFIVLSFLTAMAAASIVPKPADCMPARWLSKADIKAILAMFALWTATLVLITVMECRSGAGTHGVELNGVHQ